jgi:hypothetical protein
MNTLWGAEAKANRPLDILGWRCRRPQSYKPKRQESCDFQATLFDGHAVGVECVLHVHGGRFPLSNGAADSARRAWKSSLGKFPVFAERTYPSAEILWETKWT